MITVAGNGVTKGYNITRGVPSIPYIKVSSNGYLPLTSETTDDFCLRVKRGERTYRPIEITCTTIRMTGCESCTQSVEAQYSSGGFTNSNTYENASTISGELYFSESGYDSSEQATTVRYRLYDFKRTASQSYSRGSDGYTSSTSTTYTSSSAGLYLTVKANTVSTNETESMVSNGTTIKRETYSIQNQSYETKTEYNSVHIENTTTSYDYSTSVFMKTQGLTTVESYTG